MKQHTHGLYFYLSSTEKREQYHGSSMNGKLGLEPKHCVAQRFPSTQFAQELGEIGRYSRRFSTPPVRLKCAQHSEAKIMSSTVQPL